LKLRLGMDAEGYITKPAPKEIEPDYEGVTESGRGRGRAKRNQETFEGSNESQLETQWDQESAESTSTAGQPNDEAQSLPRPPPTTLPRYHTPRASLPLPSPSPSLSTSNPLPSANSEVSYGVYFVPKGEQAVSFVGTTNYPPPPFAEASPPLSTTSQPSFLPNYSLSSLLSSASIPPHASPMSSSSSSSNLPPALPTTPPSARRPMLQLDEDAPGAQGGSHRDGQESDERSKWFCREMSRAFGYSEAPADPSTEAHGSPLPIIRLPRFSAGFPGSTPSSSSSSIDTYLHISRVYPHFSHLLFPSNSSSTPHLPLPRLVHLFHAHQQQQSLVSNPSNFDFSQPPTCIFLPPPSATSSFRPSQLPSARKEMYVLSTAIDEVKRELESR